MPQQTKANRTAPVNERQCAESVPRNGRLRCIRWEAKPVARETSVPAAPTREETAHTKFVEDAVTSRGALAEFGTNGRYYFIFNRVTAELNGYVTQPANPALCSGAPQFLDFLLEQIAPVRKRLDDVIATDKAAREAADLRVAAAMRTAREPIASPDTPAATGVETTAPVAPAAAIAATVPEPARPRPVDYKTLINEIGMIFGEPANAGDTNKSGSALARLQGVRGLITAAPPDQSRPQLKERGLAALRTIEVGLYAEQIRRRFGLIERSVYGTADDVRAAHAAKCTCGT